MSTILSGIFQQDNIRPHISAMTRQAVKSVTTLVTRMPPRIFSITACLGYMGRRLHSCNCLRSTEDELPTQVAQAWRDHIPKDIQTLIDSLPEKIQESVRPRGWHISY
ncbi:hypothetical protein NPIL_357731 [Nephila pilipes]|uniref:Uncharacterized protein n=1 Tax=Nephila pilipes TaxID=299642 RepID=A0A8X6TP38_NEPPI|nr:hypothetical protein NPIL_357731 [Nephila pilipes]